MSHIHQNSIWMRDELKLNILSSPEKFMTVIWFEREREQPSSVIKCDTFSNCSYSTTRVCFGKVGRTKLSSYDLYTGFHTYRRGTVTRIGIGTSVDEDSHSTSPTLWSLYPNSGVWTTTFSLKVAWSLDQLLSGVWSVWCMKSVAGVSRQEFVFTLIGCQKVEISPNSNTRLVKNWEYWSFYQDWLLPSK